MELSEIIENFRGSAPPWGNKLTPSAIVILEQFLEVFREHVYKEGLNDGYKMGYDDGGLAVYVAFMGAPVDDLLEAGDIASGE